MKPSNEEINDFIHQNRPDFEPLDEPKKLPGGNLNHVWRVRGKSENLIVKHAPPHIATSPDIPLNPNRLEFEARALRLFHSKGPLSDLSTDTIRPPALYGFDNNRYFLLMEDIAPAQPWFDYLKSDKASATSALEVGNFIVNFYKKTYRDKSLANNFSNRPIQQTRLTVQYQSTEESLLKSGFDHVTRASKNAIALGEMLMMPGKCLIMGDLWPPSVLIKDGTFRLIDWEFSHFGRPLQDLAHFGAHCYMHSLFSEGERNKFKTVWLSFLEGYKTGIGNSIEAILDNDERRWLPIHFGAEILVRTAGPFREGYLFSDLPQQNPNLQAALQKSFFMLNNADNKIAPEELF